jgi:hypothetical protein
MEYISVIPAYGRDYRTDRAAAADWEAGKDFKITSIPHGQGRMISIRNLIPGLAVSIRYNRGEDVIIMYHPDDLGSESAP